MSSHKRESAAFTQNLRKAVKMYAVMPLWCLHYSRLLCSFVEPVISLVLHGIKLQECQNEKPGSESSLRYKPFSFKPPLLMIQEEIQKLLSCNPGRYPKYLAATSSGRLVLLNFSHAEVYCEMLEIETFVGGQSRTLCSPLTFSRDVRDVNQICQGPSSQDVSVPFIENQINQYPDYQLLYISFSMFIYLFIYNYWLK